MIKRKIKYNNSNIFYDVLLSCTEHTVTLKGISEINTSGFTTWRMDGKVQLGDFSDFTTVYKQGKGFIEYSNDDSVFEEQETHIEKKINTSDSLKYEQITYSIDLTGKDDISQVVNKLKVKSLELPQTSLDSNGYIVTSLPIERNSPICFIAHDRPECSFNFTIDTTKYDYWLIVADSNFSGSVTGIIYYVTV